MSDKDGRERFSEQNFLLADVKINVVLKMPFLTMSNTDVNFQAQDLQCRSYTTGDVLPTTKQVELIGKKEFTVAALDLEHEAFIIDIAVLSIDSSNKIHPSRRAQKPT